jgi:hypothetical protein
MQGDVPSGYDYMGFTVVALVWSTVKTCGSKPFCSGHGTCVDMECRCDVGWAAKDCSM